MEVGMNSVLYNNRNEKAVLESLASKKILYDYLGINVEQIQTMHAIMKSLSTQPLFTEARKMVLSDDLLNEYDLRDEPIPDLDITLMQSRIGLFDRCTEYLLNKCPEEIAYLKSRGVDRDDIEKYRLGSTRCLDFDERVNLGASVHPAMWKRYGTKEVDGIICPIEYQDGFIGTFIRILSQADMKYSSSAPNLFIHGLHDEEVWNTHEVYLVEGYFDKMALGRIRINNVITTSNAAPSVLQTTAIMKKCLVLKKTLILASDSDRAGLNEQLQLSVIAKILGVPHKFFLMPEGAKDHAELIIRDGCSREEFVNYVTDDYTKIKNRYVQLRSEIEKDEVMDYSTYLERRRTISTDWGILK